jgi:hypothetical protein
MAFGRSLCSREGIARVDTRAAWELQRCAMRVALVVAALATASCGVLPGSGIFSDRPPAPIADRDIDLVGQCTQTEDDGFRERANLVVRDNRVEALSWEIAVGRRGTCRFEHADFEQTKRRPHIELAARDRSGCKLLIWQDPRRVTLAHANCASRCVPRTVHEEAWPVMFDPRSGGCAAKL